jgi:cyclophilin family peptidyl-prolyl cis-trans isomerase
MAKRGDQSNSAGSQFFIAYADEPQLNDEFTAFGKVVEGLGVLDALTPRDPESAQDLPPGDKILSIDIQEN